VKDPELKFGSGSGVAVCNITLAVNKRFKKEGQPDADFIPVVIFNKAAEATANYMTKGKLVSISGSITTRNYEAKDGTRKYVTEVLADEINFLEKKDDGQIERVTGTNNTNEVNEVEDCSDIPF